MGLFTYCLSLSPAASLNESKHKMLMSLLIPMCLCRELWASGGRQEETSPQEAAFWRTNHPLPFSPDAPGLSLSPKRRKCRCWRVSTTSCYSYWMDSCCADLVFMTMWSGGKYLFQIVTLKYLIFFRMVNHHALNKALWCGLNYIFDILPFFWKVGSGCSSDCASKSHHTLPAARRRPVFPYLHHLQWRWGLRSSLST